MTLSDAARDIAEVIALFIATAILMRVFAGGKALRGLLASKTTGDRFTAERIQLLLVTLIVAGWYLYRVLALRGSGIPPLGNLWVGCYGTSCMLYAVGNAVRTFGNQQEPGSRQE